MNDTRSLPDRLKEDTRDLHTRAEKAPLQAALVQGTLARDAYVDMLEQMLVLHRALESRLRTHRDVHPVFRSALTDEQFQEPYLVEDLEFFGRDPAAATPHDGTAAAVDFIRRTAESDPVALIGVHYVLEGANNGNRFIARAIAGPYGLRPGGPGLRYLDPYGESQREKWSAFRQGLGEAEFTPAQQDSIVEAAKGTFQAIIDLHTGIEASAIQ